MYYTYMIRCKDNSIYTGMTKDIERRMREHFAKTEKCAKYTLKHTPLKVEAIWRSLDRSQASKLEYHIKSLKKDEKESLIKNNKNLEKFLGEKIEIDNYTRLEKLNLA